MSMLPIVLALAAVVAVLAAGYLVGARRGRDARAALREALDAQKQQSAALSHELGVQTATGTTALGDEGARALDSMTALATRDGGGVREVKSELKKILEVMDRGEQDRRAAAAKGARDVRDAVREVLSPMLEKNDLGRELAKVDAGRGLGELPKVLDAIADKGSFVTVLLSDDDGLPLASSKGSRDIETTAGMSSLFLQLAERAEKSGAPKPLSVAVRDDAGQTTLHRMFAVGATRFMLTAVARGNSLGPDALDPALVKVERALARPELS